MKAVIPKTDAQHRIVQRCVDCGREKVASPEHFAVVNLQLTATCRDCRAKQYREQREKVAS